MYTSTNIRLCIPIPDGRVEVNNKLLFSIGYLTALEVGSKVIGPPEPTTLATSKQSYDMYNIHLFLFIYIAIYLDT